MTITSTEARSDALDIDILTVGQGSIQILEFTDVTIKYKFEISSSLKVEVTKPKINLITSDILLNCDDCLEISSFKAGSSLLTSSKFNLVHTDDDMGFYFESTNNLIVGN